MNYILFHVGSLPKHFFICLNNILSVDKDSEIFVLTDSDLKLPGINTLNINEFDLLISKRKEIIEIYKDTQLEKNPLWYTSLLRVFALKSISEYYKFNKFVHFDNDVLIYEPFNKLLKSNNLILDNKINITQNDFSSLSFGYSYFSNIENLVFLNNFFQGVVNEHTKYMNEYHRGKPLNEMRILKLALEKAEARFNLLPILPYYESDFIFDPASYGQYLDGSHLTRGNYIFKRRLVSTNHIVGKELKSKRIKVKFKDHRPLVQYQKDYYSLANLHIHSKNLEKFISKNYKNYFKI